jgi:adenosylcobinamide-GDP ribazoletransferase
MRPAKYLPMMGVMIGAMGGTVYWLAAALWPSSIAVVLSLLATTLFGAGISGDSLAYRRPLWTDLLLLLITYNALMALTAANLGFSAPANLTLSLVIFCGQAASRGLTYTPRVSGASLGVALALGVAPAALLGVPGLVGLAAAIIVRLGLVPYLARIAGPPMRSDSIQRLTETCFYLGALATWKYI